jgi:dolichyl-phosphate-mannose-protein mannosyltransferase
MGTYFFDIHPPLGKLVLYWVSRLVGYDASVCSYVNIDDVYAPTCKFIYLRATSAAFGAVTVPLVYLITRNFGGSMHAGIFSALLLCFDGLNSGESRLILIDAQVIFWCAMALWIAQIWWRRWDAHVEAEDVYEKELAKLTLPADAPKHIDPVEYRKQSAPLRLAAWQKFDADPRRLKVSTRIAWALIVGLACGNAVSVKFTGLATPGLIAVESMFALFVLKRAYPFPDLLLVLATSLSIFSAYYYIHFWLLPLTGDGDEFMLPEFKRTLIGHRDYDPNAEKPPFWDSLVYVSVPHIPSFGHRHIHTRYYAVEHGHDPL